MTKFTKINVLKQMSIYRKYKVKMLKVETLLNIKWSLNIL